MRHESDAEINRTGNDSNKLKYANSKTNILINAM